jgi:competence ComEA-like helix-hairpin-helix protein
MTEPQENDHASGSQQHWTAWSWGRSLLWKSGILGMGLSAVLWVGWPQPDLREDHPSPLPRVSQQSTTIHPFSYSATQAAGASTITPLPLAGEGDEKILQVSSATLLVDLNLSSRMDLETLPGIGGTLAERIVSYRSIHGAFQQIEDLLHISGIGAKRLKRLTPFVKI